MRSARRALPQCIRAFSSSSGEASVLLDLLWSLCKRRGLVFPGSSLYGGLSGTCDYGPLGVLLKRNLQRMWWNSFVTARGDCVGVETSVLMHPQVWNATGHVEHFTDALVTCRVCDRRFRVERDAFERLVCPQCSSVDLQEPEPFSLLLSTAYGSTGRQRIYLRPETAQGMFTTFHTIANTMRKRLPLGVAQVGRSFRNEISPSPMLFRLREFDQMEMEYFCHPSEASYWFDYWVRFCFDWVRALGIREENLRLRCYDKNELAHYATACTDIEYKFPFGWGELWGIANRGDYDLRRHMEMTGKDLRVMGDAENKPFLPHAIEPALGLDRLVLVVLLDAYHTEQVPTQSNTEEDSENSRVVLRLHTDVAPYKYAILPLVKKRPLMEVAERLFTQISKHTSVDMDVTGSIGRRYRRHDEIGTPFCVTVDFETLEDECVTIRHRDTMHQDRVSMGDLLL